MEQHKRYSVYWSFPGAGSCLFEKICQRFLCRTNDVSDRIQNATTTNKDNIAASNLLENIAKFLESGEFTLKDKNFDAEQINRTSDVFCGTADGKTTELAINMQLKYFYKK